MLTLGAAVYRQHIRQIVKGSVCVICDLFYISHVDEKE